MQVRAFQVRIFIEEEDLKKYNYVDFFKSLKSKNPTESELQKFVPKFYTSMELAAISTVWYLNKVDSQKYFNGSSINRFSASINYLKAITKTKYIRK